VTIFVRTWYICDGALRYKYSLMVLSIINVYTYYVDSNGQVTLRHMYIILTSIKTAFMLYTFIQNIIRAGLLIHYSCFCILLIKNKHSRLDKNCYYMKIMFSSISCVRLLWSSYRNMLRAND